MHFHPFLLTLTAISLFLVNSASVPTSIADLTLNLALMSTSHQTVGPASGSAAFSSKVASAPVHTIADLNSNLARLSTSHQTVEPATGAAAVDARASYESARATFEQANAEFQTLFRNSNDMKRSGKITEARKYFKSRKLPFLFSIGKMRKAARAFKKATGIDDGSEKYLRKVTIQYHS
jgi:hypothetical protein